MIRRFALAIFGFAMMPLLAAAQTPVAPSAREVLVRAVAQEARLQQWMVKYEPIIETYARNSHPARKANDLYFLGRLDLHREFLLGGGNGFDQKVLFGRSRQERRLYSPIGVPINFTPQGFSAMLFPFTGEVDPSAYRVALAGREIYEGVDCAVYSVVPAVDPAYGMFVGRMWIDLASGAIVRFRGTFQEHWSPAYTYLHFDSVRQQLTPGFWVPTAIYVEEKAATESPKLYGLEFTAVTRVWDYRLKKNESAGDFPALKPRSAAGEGDDTLPRSLAELEQQGLIAAPGQVESDLNATVARIEAASGLHSQINCRVLLTAPVEAFSIGNTIVLSRGLLDELPNSAAAAPVLAREMARILLGQTDSAAPSNLATMFDDPAKFKPFRLRYSARQDMEAARRAAELLNQAGIPDTAATAVRGCDRAEFRQFYSPRFATGTGAPDANAGSPDVLASRFAIQPWTNRLYRNAQSETIAATAGARQPAGQSRQGDKE